LKTLIKSLFVLIFSASLATADAVKLDGQVIRSLFAGNTAIGRLDGEKYRQWFGEDGSMLLSKQGSETIAGEWRVDDISQELQIILNGSDRWNGWYIMEFGQTYYWVSKTTPPTPFQILEGKKLTAD